MGQFNKASSTSTKRVLFWRQKFLPHFAEVAVAGDFSEDVRYELQSFGVVVVPVSTSTKSTIFQDSMSTTSIRNDTGRNGKQHDMGYYSPMEHLLWTLQYYSNRNKETSRQVEGVLYIHDDALVNVSEWIAASHLQITEASPDGKYRNTEINPDSNHLQFLSGSIIANRYPTVYRDLSHLVFHPPASSLSSSLNATIVSRYSYTVHVEDGRESHSDGPKTSNTYFTNPLGYRYETPEELLSTLDPWKWFDPWCLPGQMDMVRSAAFVYRSLDSTGNEYNTSYSYFREVFLPANLANESQRAVTSMTFAPRAQSDVLFVPISVANVAVAAMRLHTESEPAIFLECAIPQIVDMIYQVTQIPVHTVVLCTDWDHNDDDMTTRAGDGVLPTAVDPSTTHSEYSNHRRPTGSKQKKWTQPRQRGSSEMIRNCLSGPAASETYGVFHPFKLSQGLMVWNELWDAVNEARDEHPQ